MDCPVLDKPEKTEVRCGNYSLSFLDNEGPVNIKGESGEWQGGFWQAWGKEAEKIIGYVNAGNPEKAEEYIDHELGKREWF